MVSPNLTRISESKLTLNKNTKKLFQVIYRDQNKKDETGDDSPKIKVSELISKMAFYYEKIRNSVDYDEEYLLRKNAIERILKRQIVIEGFLKVSKSEEMAKTILIELIRAGYLPNNKIPEKKIKDIGIIIEKYIKLRNYSLARFSTSSHFKHGNIGKINDELKQKNSLTNWLISVAASEIEENLGENNVQRIIISNMYETLLNNIKLPDDLPYEKDLEIQIYLSIHRNFLRFDQDMLSFILFKYFNSSWSNPSDEDIAKISQNIEKIRNAILMHLNHPLRKQLNKIINRYTVFFMILTEVIEDNPSKVYDDIINDIKAFPRIVKNTCLKKYKKVKSKLWRSAMRSIIYIFLTKSIFVILLEIPAIKLFGEKINPVSLGINIIFPAFLLYLIVLFTKIPSENNTKKIIEGIEEIVFEEREKKEPFLLRKPIGRGKAIAVIFSIFYTITFFTSFGLVIFGLNKLGFNWVSIIIFLFFLAFVSFFGIRVRKATKDLIVIESKENIFSFLMDFFYIPIVAVGKWLSEKFSRLNIFVFILDFIIEAPFKIFVEIAEEWTKYVKERKDDII